MCRLCSMVGRGNDVRSSFEIFNGTVTRSTTSRVRSTTSRVRLACSICRLRSSVGRGSNVRSSFEIFNGTVTRSTASRVRSTTSRVRLAACSMCRVCSMVVGRGDDEEEFFRSPLLRWSFQWRKSVTGLSIPTLFGRTFFGRTLFLVATKIVFFSIQKGTSFTWSCFVNSIPNK
jgi:hypothetical protein